MNPETNPMNQNFGNANVGNPATPATPPVPPVTPTVPPAQPTVPVQPAPAQPAPQPISPAANPAAAAANSADSAAAPTMARLSVPVVSPTHFDDQNLAHPVVGTPGAPMQPAQPAQDFPPMKTTAEAQAVKKFTTLSIILGAVAGVMFLLTVIFIVVSVSNGSKLAATEQDLNNKNAIVAAVESTTGVSPIDNPDQVPVWKTTQGYIYITEWQIKLKIPDDLTSVSYILDQKYRPSICFNAVKKGVQYFPAFADVAQNPGGMGCLTRVATTEGNNDASTGLSFGTKVFTYKEYSYFYTAPYKKNDETGLYFSKDKAEQGLEATAVQIIKNMITDNISQYE